MASDIFDSRVECCDDVIFNDTCKFDRTSQLEEEEGRGRPWRGLGSFTFQQESNPGVVRSI